MFRTFVEKHRDASKWLISADYCLHDASRPNDCMCFSITSYDIEFDGLKSAVQAVMGRDLKKTKTISEDAAIFLRDPCFFHVAILLSKQRNMFASGPGSDPLAVARDAAALTVRQFEEYERGADAIRRAREMLNASRANGFNYELYGDMLLLSLFLPFISLLIAREREPDVVGRFSDRDNMTTWCDGLIWSFALENVHGLAAQRQIRIDKTQFPIAVPEPNTGEMWFDHLVRLADYIAGTLAVWDLQTNNVPVKPTSDKFLRIIEDVIADSDNMVILGLDIGNQGLQWKRVNVVRNIEPSSNVSAPNQ